MSHYYSEKQDTKFVSKLINIKLKETQFELYSAPGVFSKDKLDNGTKLLIEKCEINENDEVLDLGCGYGVVGIAIKKMYPDTNIFMVDVNKRAVKLTKINLKLHKLSDVKVTNSDLYKKIDKKFNVILSNPPQSAGKELCFNIITQAKNYLEKNGSLQIGARHQKGGKDLSKKMNEIFGNVGEIAKGSGFRVYISYNK